MGKYFTVEVKPTIPNVAAGQHTQFAADDLLFDWFAFDIPKGTSRLINATMEIRPKLDSGATVNECDLDLVFAKTVNGEAPRTLGTSNSALGADRNLANHMVAYIARTAWGAFEQHLDATSFTMLADDGTSRFNIHHLLFTGEPDSGTNVGYDRFYVAGIAHDTFDFRSEIQINNGTLDGDIFTVDGVSPLLGLAAGDVIAATATADTSVSKSLGTVKSLTTNRIVLESTTETAVVDDDFIYNTTPIRITLHFEK